MTGRPRTIRHGLSLLELLLALGITAMVSTAIAGMMNVVSAGTVTRRDNRSIMVRANAAQTRLSAYVAPSRCFLNIKADDLVVWLNDDRQGETVHATEVRWIVFDPVDGAIDVHFVKFPDGWSQTARDLEDKQYAANADWWQVLTTYQSKGWVAQLRLVDGISGVTLTTDEAAPVDSRHIYFDLDFLTESGVQAMRVTATERLHQAPLK